MTETGVVYKIKRNIATVRFQRKTACENCRMCLKPRNEMFVELKVENSLNAKEGDSVVIEMGDRAVVLSSFIVYFLPLIPVAISLICTQRLTIWISLAITMVVLVLSFVGIALLDKFVIRKKKGFVPTMKSIINEVNENGIN